MLAYKKYHELQHLSSCGEDFLKYFFLMLNVIPHCGTTLSPFTQVSVFQISGQIGFWDKIFEKCKLVNNFKLSPFERSCWPLINITNLNSFYHPRIICAKLSLNWPCGSGEDVENIKRNKWTNKQTDDGHRWSEKFLELSVQVNLKMWSSWRHLNLCKLHCILCMFSLPFSIMVILSI